MYHKIIFLLFILSACAQREAEVGCEEKVQAQAKDDSIFLNTVKAIAHEQAIVKELASKDTSLAYKILLVKYDTLLAQANRLQNDRLELVAVKNNFTNLKKETDELLKKIESLNNKNILIAESLAIQKDVNRRVTIERDKANSQIAEAGKLKIDQVTVIAFNKKDEETAKASRVKRVEVQFVLPENKLFTPKTFYVKAVIKGIKGINTPKGVEDSIQVTYNGSKQENTIPFNQKIEWNPEAHIVQVLVGKEIMNTVVLTLR